MSPKSRGRPAKKRAQRPARQPSTVTPERRALHEARVLLQPDADALAAELFASQFLGRAWARAALGDRSPEYAAAQRVAEAIRRPEPAAAAALAAFRLVLPPDVPAGASGVLPDLGMALPAWAGEPPPKPTTAWLSEDPWGAERTWLVGYGEPAPHVLMASVLEPGGPEVVELTVARPDAPQRYDELRGEAMSPLREVAPGAALAALREAAQTTDLLWPRQPSESYTDTRLLAWRRIRAHADPEPSLDERLAVDRLPEAERLRLRTAFLRGAADVDSQSVAYLLGIFLDYGAGYISRDPLRWSPADVMMFLLDYVPRKVILDDGDRAALPALLADWVRFALAERGVESRWIDVVVDAVSDHTEEFHAAYDDDASAGPAKQLARWLSAEGIDVTDREAADAAVGRWNAEQLARRALTATRPLPTGSAYQLTISLRGLRPRVWRRIVVPAEWTLARCHDAVQMAMGWHDAHLHVWEVAGERYGRPTANWAVSAEDGVTLADVAAEGSVLDYTYDFGDDWEHEITVDRVLLPAEAGHLPRCDAGGRACPPEDIGGIDGYAELVEALANPQAGSEWERELADGFAGFDPQRFDAEATDRALKAFLGRTGG